MEWARKGVPSMTEADLAQKSTILSSDFFNAVLCMYLIDYVNLKHPHLPSLFYEDAFYCVGFI